jgi:hypothetical protein
MFMSRHQTAGRNQYIKVLNKSFENVVAEFKYLGTLVTNQNCIHKEIKSRVNSALKWSHYVPPKRWYVLTSPHAVTTQKTPLVPWEI